MWQGKIVRAVAVVITGLQIPPRNHPTVSPLACDLRFVLHLLTAAFGTKRPLDKS
jgi:hypothetical protein